MKQAGKTTGSNLFGQPSENGSGIGKSVTLTPDRLFQYTGSSNDQ